MDKQTTEPAETHYYKGLGHLLYIVRWSQHLLAILAEVLILLSFAMSGMDVSLGGVMVSVPILKILWAGMFALGIDTAFVLSWVRVRQCTTNRHWLAFSWNMLLAVGLSVILFQPIAVQLLQQSLSINFIQALSQLGINIVFLTYARSAVAVLLGAILAVTNVESEMIAQPIIGPKRKVILFERLLDQVAPVVREEALPAPTQVSEASLTPAPIDVSDEQPAQLPVPIAQPVVQLVLTPRERKARIRSLDFSGLSTAERVEKVLTLFPDIPDRELGRLSGVSAATAKKYRNTVHAMANLPVEG